jgi:hypothetical protein
MKYLAILPFLFMIFPAHAEQSFDDLFNNATKDGCINREEFRELEMHPMANSSGMRPLSLIEIKKGSDVVGFDLDGPNNELTVYVSFHLDKNVVRLAAFDPKGCLFGMKDMPDVIAAMFMDRMAAE